MQFSLPFFMRVLRRARRSLKPPDSSRSRSHQAQGLSRQAGASIIEFPLVAVPLLFVGLGSVEVAHWLLTRQAISLALLQAARAGATDHGRPDTMEAAFEDALLPLFPGNARHSALQSRAAAFAQRVHDTGLPPWQIQILSPTAAAFDDFGGGLGPIRAGRASMPALPAINNNYQLEQHRRHAAAGWPSGRGPRSGQTIFEANTLVLRLRYLHEPALPGIKTLLRLLGNEGGTYGQRAMARGGYLPITREIALTMDSHPWLWPMPASGKFAVPSGQHAATAPGVATCQEWGCPGQAGQPFMSPAGPQLHQPPSGSPASGTPASDTFDASRGTGGMGNPWSGSPQSAGDTSVMNEALAVAPDDPACGAALCCATG